MNNLIIIPAYNEAGNIERTIADIKEHTTSFDYIIVNDCSRDETLQICRKNHYNYLNLPVNLGIGGAVQAGYRYAYFHNYETAVQFDGDGQHDASYLESMLCALKEQNADMVIGSRFLEKEGFQSNSLRRVGIRFFTRLIRAMTGVTITDPTSGLRIVNAKILHKFAFDYPRDYPEPESIVSILCEGATVKEVPVIMRERLAGKSSINIRAGAWYMIKVGFAIFLAKLKG